MATRPDTIRRPDAVVFDFDGVIADTEPLHYKAFQKVLQPLGLGYTWNEYVATYMGFDDRDAFTEAFRARGLDLDDTTRKRLVVAKSEVFQEVVRDGIASYPGAVTMIASLHAVDIPLAICSGALRSDIVPILQQLGVAHCFRHIVSADDVRKSKPDPECYALAFDRLSRTYPDRVTAQGNCLAVEDTPAGIRAAKGAGLTVLAVTNSYAGSELGDADYIAASLADVRIS